MPRTGLTSDYKIELARKAAAPLMSAVFHFPAPTGDVFVSDRECVIGGQAHRGPIASFGNYKESLKARDGNFQIGHMPMTIINTPIFGAPAKRFSDLWAGVALEGLEVDVYQNFRQAGGTILQAPFHSFVMRKGIYTPRTSAFDLISVSEKYLDKKEIGFLIDQTDFPRASLRAIGQRANILYGQVKRAKTHAIEANPASPLRLGIGSADAEIPIYGQFLITLPTAGRIQIGGEQIDYAGKRTTFLVATNKANINSSADASSYATGSHTPGANKLQLFAVGNSKASSPDVPTVSGNSLTWVQIATIVFSSNGRRLTLFGAIGATPTAGATTVDFGAQVQTGCEGNVVEIDGVSGATVADIIAQSASSSDTAVTSLTVNLGTFANSENATFAAFSLAANNTVTSGAGFTELFDNGHTTPNSRMQTEFRDDGDTTADATFSSADAAGIAVEIKGATLQRLTGATRGVGGTDAVIHVQGDTIYLLQEPYTFLAAGHAIKSIANVYIKKGDQVLPVPPSRYATELANGSLAPGKTLALIKFTTPPFSTEMSHQQAAASPTVPITLGLGQSSVTVSKVMPTQDRTQSSGRYIYSVRWHMTTSGETNLQFLHSGIFMWLKGLAGANPFTFASDTYLSLVSFTLSMRSGTAGQAETVIIDSITVDYLVATTLTDMLSIGSGIKEKEISQSAIGDGNTAPAGSTSVSITLNFAAQRFVKSSGKFKYSLGPVLGFGDSANLLINVSVGGITRTIIDTDVNGAQTVHDLSAIESNVYDTTLVVTTLKKSGGTFTFATTISCNIASVTYSIFDPEVGIQNGDLLDQSTADILIGGEVLFDGEGAVDDGVGTYTGSAGALIENPADFLHYLARALGGVPVERIDVPAFVQARADLPSYFKLGGVVTERSSNLKELLLALGLQSRLRPDWPIDKLTVRALKTAYNFTLYDGAPKILTENQIAADGDGRKEPSVSTLKIDFSDPNDIINSFKILYGRDFSMARGAESFRKSTAVFEDAASINTNGLRQQAERFWCDFITEDNAAMANDMGAFWLVRLKKAARIVSLDCFLDQFPVINGDVIGLNFAAQKGGTGASFFPYTFPITFGAAGLPGEIFDGWNGTQMLLVEQFERRPGSARDKRGDRMALVLREVQ